MQEVAGPVPDLAARRAAGGPLRRWCKSEKGAVQGLLVMRVVDGVDGVVWWIGLTLQWAPTFQVASIAYVQMQCILQSRSRGLWPSLGVPPDDVISWFV